MFSAAIAVDCLIHYTLNSALCFDAVLGGKKKPLKQPKKDDKELDDVCTFISFICNI